jgi:hypothetical protein
VPQAPGATAVVVAAQALQLAGDRVRKDFTITMPG